MTDQRSLAALARIEAALARIDRLPLQGPASPAPPNQNAQAELVARHDALRSEARRAIAELDLVLEGLR
jgi:hypothetical protein